MSESESPEVKPRVRSLIPFDGLEPASDEPGARRTWSAVTAPWHPAILVRLDHLPAIDGLESSRDPGTTSLVAGIADDAADVEATADRDETVRRLADRLGIEWGDPLDPADLVRDFHALGLARWWLRDLTTAMQHADCLDHAGLEREALDAARAWAAGDAAGATSGLRAAFESMTQARERFYPVDAFILDVQLLDPKAPVGVLGPSLDAHQPFTLLATAKAIEALADRDPDAMASLLGAVEGGWVDVIGGPFDEVDEPLRPLASILWQFRRGASTYRKYLDDRTVETLAARRSALYPIRPQIGRRFGFRFGVYWALDAGRFPMPDDSKRLWGAPDGTNLESLTRLPASATREHECPMLPWRLGRSMRDDHVATLPLLHWPGRAAPWFDDLRRIAAYSPVLARLATAGDYFHLTDRPHEVFRPEVDEFLYPYLDQAASEPSPIARRAQRTALRARFDAVVTLGAIAHALDPTLARDAESIEPLETAIETDSELNGRLDLAEQRAAVELARAIVPPIAGGANGYLVLNPLGVARRVAVVLPDAPLTLPLNDRLLAVQLTERGVEAVVAVPAFGYAWISSEPSPGLETPAPSRVEARGRILRNDLLELELDAQTGGIRRLHASGEDAARLAQQIVLVGPDLRDAAGQPVSSKMRADSVVPEYGGPALAEAVSRGALVHPATDQPLARFEQRVRISARQSLVELEISLSELDPSWLATLANGSPWDAYIACRWAWPDAQSGLRRSLQLGMEPTTAERPETAEAIEIESRRLRTLLLFGGLAHHKRHGHRMLDTLLVAGAESGRQFRLAVALDWEHPAAAIADSLTPALVAATSGGSPPAGPSGWLFQIDSRNVAVVRVDLAPAEEGRTGVVLLFDLIETASRSTRVRLRCFRDPVRARQTDLNGDLVVDLQVSGDAVLFDLTPRELTRIEVHLP